MVRGIQAHQTGQQRPGAEGAGAQRRDLRRDFLGRLARDRGAGVERDVGGWDAVVWVGIVEAGGKVQGCVGLDGVAD
jgi:hypothetical protein